MYKSGSCRVVGRGTMLQAGRSRVRFMMCSLDFCSCRPVALGSTQSLTELSTRNFPGGKGQPAREAGSLTAVCEPIV
jgi:hypothetical protein